jgi:hypothetical protein
MAAEDELAGLRAEAYRRVPGPAGLGEVIDDIGRRRLAAYYLYAALLAGVTGDDGLPTEHWPPELAEPMARLGVTLAVGLHPLGTVAGLGAQLIQARIQAGQDQADALRRLGRDLQALHAQADGELAFRQARKST